MSRAAPEAVVLIHGLWMRGWVCWPLKRFLQQAGFEVFVFSYPSLRAPFVDHVERLQHFVAALGREPVHFVGHSLGGLLALAYLERAKPTRNSRVVTLGSPYAGCHAADWLAARAWGRRLLGRCLPPWPAACAHGTTRADVGVIAGTRRFGLGSLVVRGLPSPNDGVVALAETEVPGAARLVLPVSHSGMLVSSAVAAAVTAFLRRGAFDVAEARA